MGVGGGSSTGVLLEGERRECLGRNGTWRRCGILLSFDLAIERDLFKGEEVLEAQALDKGFHVLRSALAFAIRFTITMTAHGHPVFYRFLNRSLSFFQYNHSFPPFPVSRFDKSACLVD